MKERDFQSKFTRFLKGRDDFCNSSFELKFVNTTHKKSVNPKSDFQPQQLPMLHKAKHKGLVHKLSDMSAGLKPFDCFKIKGPAYVAIMFWVPRKRNQTFHIIDIDDFLLLMETHPKPYLKEEDIAAVSTQYTL